MIDGNVENIQYKWLIQIMYCRSVGPPDSRTGAEEQILSARRVQTREVDRRLRQRPQQMHRRALLLTYGTKVIN